MLNVFGESVHGGKALECIDLLLEFKGFLVKIINHIDHSTEHVGIEANPKDHPTHGKHVLYIVSGGDVSVSDRQQCL